MGCDLLAMSPLPTVAEIMRTMGNPNAIRGLIPVNPQARAQQDLQQKMQQLLAHLRPDVA